MDHDVIETIEAERVLLRHWHTDDAEALYKYASDHRVSELALWPCHESVEMSRQVIEQYFMPNPYCFDIVLKESGEPIGCIGLVPGGEENHHTSGNEREVGYWIGHPFWNKGLTTEALTRFIAYCHSSSEIDSLMITTDSRNIGSQRVAEKCGFRFAESFKNNGIDSKCFTIRLGFIK